MTTRRQRTAAELNTRAQEILAKHQYTQLAVAPGVEVWQCARPGSSAYGFSIMITRFGIAVVGDMTNLTFSVGMGGYGMPFLAGDDIDYYIYSKLDHACRLRVEFDHESLLDAVCESVCDLIDSEYRDDDEYLPVGTPAWIGDASRSPDARGGKFTELLAWVEAQHAEASEDVRWIRLLNPLREIRSVENVEQARASMQEHADDLDLGPDWWEISITQPSQSIMQTLYTVNLAARAIEEIKAQAPVAEGAA